MTAQVDDDCDVNGLSVQWLRDMAVFRFSNRPLFFAADLERRDELLGALDHCERTAAIRVIVLIGFPEKVGRGEYEQFYRAAQSDSSQLLVRRMLNVFNQFILGIIDSSKPVVFVDSGRVISQFFNVGLACDYRIISDNTVVEKEFLKHGMLPKGGGAWFLSQLLGRNRAFQLLLSDEDITAAEALRLGLVDEVVPNGRLNEAGLAAARRFAALPSTTVSGVKKLVNYGLRELSAYLEYENHELLMAMRKVDFTAVDRIEDDAAAGGASGANSKMGTGGWR